MTQMRDEFVAVFLLVKLLPFQFGLLRVLPFLCRVESPVVSFSWSLSVLWIKAVLHLMTVPLIDMIARSLRVIRMKQVAPVGAVVDVSDSSVEAEGGWMVTVVTTLKFLSGLRQDELVCVRYPTSTCLFFRGTHHFSNFPPSKSRDHSCTV